MESITLHAKHAEIFKDLKLGQKVTFTVEGEIRDMGFSEGMNGPSTPGEKAKKGKGKREHHVTIYIEKLSRKGGKAARDMNDDEFEEEISRTKEGLGDR